MNVVYPLIWSREIILHRVELLHRLARHSLKKHLEMRHLVVIISYSFIIAYNVQIVVLNHQNLIQGGPRGGTIKLTRAGKSHFCNREKSKNQIKRKLGGFATNEFSLAATMESIQY